MAKDELEIINDLDRDTIKTMVNVKSFIGVLNIIYMVLMNRYEIQMLIVN